MQGRLLKNTVSHFSVRNKHVLKTGALVDKGEEKPVNTNLETEPTALHEDKVEY